MRAINPAPSGESQGRLSTAAIVFLIVGLCILVAIGLMVAAKLFLHIADTNQAPRRLTVALFGLYVFPVLTLLLAAAFLLRSPALRQAWTSTLMLAAILWLLAWKQEGELVPGFGIPGDIFILIGIFGIGFPFILLLRAGSEIDSIQSRIGLGSKRG